MKRSVTLTKANAEEVLTRVGTGEFSSFVDRAVGRELQRLRLAELLADLDRQHGPIPAEDLEWAERTVAALRERRG